MIPYNVRFAGTLGATTTALATIISGATRSLLIVELDIEGMGNASAANELGLYRVATAGITGSGALTFVPLYAPNMTGTTPALAFSGTGFGGYTTQPIAGALAHPIAGPNSNGQRYFWRCNPNLNNAIPVPGGNNAAGSVAFFPISGTGVISGRVQLLEI